MAEEFPPHPLDRGRNHHRVGAPLTLAKYLPAAIGAATIWVSAARHEVADDAPFRARLQPTVTAILQARALLPPVAAQVAGRPRQAGKMSPALADILDGYFAISGCGRRSRPTEMDPPVLLSLAAPPHSLANFPPPVPRFESVRKSLQAGWCLDFFSSERMVVS